MSSTERLWLVVALLLGALVRLLPVAGAAGPVGDGGLFFAMVEDLRTSGLSIPATTSYNQLDIPFVYPPLALWTAALVADVAGISTLQVVTWMPPVVSVLCLGAFAWLAWRTLPAVAAVGATLAYALMPHAYGWVIAGGGTTRGVGLLLALAAMAVAADRVRVSLLVPIAAGGLLGLAALSHPQAAVFGVLGCLVVSWRGPLAAWLPRLAVAAVAAAVVVLPWLVAMISTHGVEVMLGASHRVEPVTGLIRMLNLRFSGAPFMDVFAVAGVVGLVVSVSRREPRLPLLLIVTYVAGAGGGEFLAAVPWALLAGVGVAALAGVVGVALQDARPAASRWVGTGLAGLVLFLALIGSLGSVADRSSKLHSVTAGQQEAMAWLTANTAPSIRVLVPTSDVWGDDEVSEWLPALAERRSIGTVQGSEWLGRDPFRAQLQRHTDIRDCSGGTAECYRTVDPEALIFVPKGRLAGPFSEPDCCVALRETLAANGYEVLYDGPGATIARPGG